MENYRICRNLLIATGTIISFQITYKAEVAAYERFREEIAYGAASLSLITCSKKESLYRTDSNSEIATIVRECLEDSWATAIANGDVKKWRVFNRVTNDYRKEFDPIQRSKPKTNESVPKKLRV